MTYYKFHEDDLFINTIETYPQYSFYVQGSSMWLDNVQNITGATGISQLNVPTGSISLYEYNIHRTSGNYIYPFLIKSGVRAGFKKK